MEAHKAFERFGHVAGRHGGHSNLELLSRDAAAVVAVLAAFLAIATFLSNQAVKEIITGETRAADTSGRFEANDVKSLIASANSTLLRVVGTGNSKMSAAVAKARALEARIQSELAPRDRVLRRQIAGDQTQRDRADNRHVLYELSVVGLQIGIVLAGISILARRRWLLGGGGAAGLAGVVLLFAGLAY
jgi:hypothetical protein